MSSRVDITYASVEAFERSKALKSGRSHSHVFTVALLAVFFIVLMVGLAAGVAMYKSAADAQMETGATRLETGLLTSYIRANDTADALGVGAGPEGRALVLTERLESGTYEVRIYQYQGKIVQEYSVAGAEYTPARAQVLLDSKTFDFSLDGKLLTITTDQGPVNVTMRCLKGGAA